MLHHDTGYLIYQPRHRAVGGYPSGSSLDDIKQLEQFDRGWYSGPVGWIGHDAAEFAVAIRSGLLAHGRLTLFSGAGIVEGSIPDMEWNETEHKLSHFLNAISKQNQ